MNYKSALIVGAGSGLSASLARVFAKAGMKVALAARSAAKLAEFVKATGAKALTATPPSATRSKSCSPLSMPPAHPMSSSTTPATARAGRSPNSIRRGRESDRDHGFGASWWRRRRSSACCRGKQGAILFTGASASVKGYAQSAPFAMGKFALARPGAKHGARIVAAGHPRRAFRHRRRHQERAPRRCRPDKPDALLDPDAIAQSYLACAQQPRSAWTQEIELRPWVEKF